MGRSSSAQDDLSFRDEFTGSKLAPEFRVVNPDPNRMALSMGTTFFYLLMRITRMSWLYNGDLPKNMNSIDVQNHSLRAKNKAWVGMTEGDNGIYAGLFYPSTLRHLSSIFFDKWLDGEVSSYKVDIPNGDISSPFSQKIESKGVKYACQLPAQ